METENGVVETHFGNGQLESRANYKATNPACFLGAVSSRVIFSSYVNEKVAWLAYGDFIRFALSNTNGNVRFGYYVDGEPFCSGSFGELRYSGFLKHGW